MLLFLIQEDFLKARIKVNGKAGDLGDSVKVGKKEATILITTSIPMSKRYMCVCAHA